MQHEAVLCLAEHLDAHQHRDKGAEAADEEHVDVQRDAPHHRAAEARDIPVHGVQLDDLLHIEAADGKGHLGGVVEDGGEIQQRGDEHAPDVHDCLLYTFRAHETRHDLVCRLLLEKKKKKQKKKKKKTTKKKKKKKKQKKKKNKKK